MLRIPDRFRADIILFQNRIANNTGDPALLEDWYTLAFMFFLAEQDERQRSFFAACAGAPWLEGVPQDDRNAQLSALASRFEERPESAEASPALSFTKGKYPLILPYCLEEDVYNLADALGRSTAATLYAMLALAITDFRGAVLGYETSPIAVIDYLAA